MPENLKNQDNNDYSVELLKERLPQFLEEMKGRLNKKIISQDRAIRRLMRNISIYYAKLNDSKRPIAIFLFSGPSGSGKTYTAEELAYALIGKPKGGLNPLVKIDCGGLSLKHTVASLTGSPPGYVGYGDQTGIEAVGQHEKEKLGLNDLDIVFEEFLEKIMVQAKTGHLLPSQVKKTQKFIRKLRERVEEEFGPFRSVVLFDEIEKADMNVQSQLLRILDEGILQLHNGKVVNFRGSIIILTTNVGTKQILDDYLSKNTIGFNASKGKGAQKEDKNLDKKIWRRVKGEIKEKGHFKPELLGRIGDKGIIVFHSLDRDDYQKILDLQLEEVQDYFGDALSISYTKRFKKFLIEEGVSPEYGARALRDVIKTHIRTEIANKILNKFLKIGDSILMDVKIIREIGGDDKEKKTVKAKIKRQARKAGVRVPSFETRLEETRDFDNIGEALKGFLDEFFESGKKEKPIVKEVKNILDKFLKKLFSENENKIMKILSKPQPPFDKN